MDKWTNRDICRQ